MKNYTITEEQIKELAKGNKKLEKMFPEVFEAKLELNRWYKREHCEGSLVFLTKQESENTYSGYGICRGRWEENYVAYNEIYKCIPATEEEVKEALIKEAERRGFKNGVRVDAKNIGNGYYRNLLMNSNCFNFDESVNQLCLGNYSIFKDGKWAEILKTKYLTKKQAEEALKLLHSDGYEYQITD